jgi:hypothetical protein
MEIDNEQDQQMLETTFVSGEPKPPNQPQPNDKMDHQSCVSIYNIQLKYSHTLRYPFSNSVVIFLPAST